MKVSHFHLTGKRRAFTIRKDNFEKPQGFPPRFERLRRRSGPLLYIYRLVNRFVTLKYCAQVGGRFFGYRGASRHASRLILQNFLGKNRKNYTNRRCRTQMPPYVTVIIAVVVGLVCAVVGFVLGYQRRKAAAEREIGSAEEEARRVINDAIKSAEFQGGKPGPQAGKPGAQGGKCHRPHRSAGQGAPGAGGPEEQPDRAVGAHLRPDGGGGQALPHRAAGGRRHPRGGAEAQGDPDPVQGGGGDLRPGADRPGHPAWYPCPTTR